MHDGRYIAAFVYIISIVTVIAASSILSNTEPVYYTVCCHIQHWFVNHVILGLLYVPKIIINIIANLACSCTVVYDTRMIMIGKNPSGTRGLSSNGPGIALARSATSNCHSILGAG